MNIQEILEMDLADLGFLESKIKGVDIITGGYAKGELTILCGSTGSGKSIVSLTSACVMSEDTSVLYVSCENSMVDDKNRMYKIIEQYDLDPKAMLFEYENLDNSTIGFDELEKLIVDSCCEAIFLDSIDFIEVPASTGSESYNNYGIVAKKLRNIARKYDVALIATAQVNREGYSKPFKDISVAFLADSIKIGRQAHDIWYVSMPDCSGMKLLKHRGELRYRPDLRMFCMATVNHYEMDIRHVWGNSPLGVPDLLKEIKKYE